jgi:hypothetical protein
MSGDVASFTGCYCENETAKALLVRIDGRSVWVPKSQIHDDSEVYDADNNRSGKLIVSQWWAEKEGLV